MLQKRLHAVINDKRFLLRLLLKLRGGARLQGAGGGFLLLPRFLPVKLGLQVLELAIQGAGLGAVAVALPDGAVLVADFGFNALPL
jgi:hypothetical protein